jgi:hypothetical protein
MEVILGRGDSKSEAWSCKVSLRFEHEEVPNQELGVFEFDRTTVKEDVALLLRRAQLAILNPNTELSVLQKLIEDDFKTFSSEMSFSRNSVVLEIMGAEVDVTFLDLPGIIASTEKVQRIHCKNPVLNIG